MADPQTPTRCCRHGLVARAGGADRRPAGPACGDGRAAHGHAAAGPAPGGQRLDGGRAAGLFAAAPVLLACTRGRLADRLGYHRPVRIAAALAHGGHGLGVAVTVWLPGLWPIAALVRGRVADRRAANMGMLTIQRTAGLAARNATERMRIFSWLGVAPSFSERGGPGGRRADDRRHRLCRGLPAADGAAAGHAGQRAPRAGAAAAPGAGRAPNSTAWDLLANPG
jgi:hypothetical protein